MLINQLRIVLVAVKGFRNDRISLRASALTYYTTLSVVPIAAMVFGIAQGFGFQEKLEEEIRKRLSEREEMQAVVDYILQFARNMLANINGSFIAGVGLVVLFWSVMQVFGNIESSFNAIWRINKPRPLVRKFSDYLSMMLVAPVLLFLSSTSTVYISEFAAREASIFQYLGPMVEFLINLIPYVLVFLLFTLLYVVMPNTKVKFKNGLFAGIIAGTIFQITQWFYIHFQVGVSKYSAIYGSFMALPLFLIWLQLSWLIVLLGAEISFAFQSIENYEFESEADKVNPSNKRLLTFLVLHLIIKQFSDGIKPMTASGISHQLGIPVRLVRDILLDLTESKLIIEATTDSPKERAYVPSIDINKLSISYVIEQLDTRGFGSIMAEETDDLKAFSAIQRNLLKSIRKSKANKLIKDI
jgi:membrane protein